MKSFIRNQQDKMSCVHFNRCNEHCFLNHYLFGIKFNFIQLYLQCIIFLKNFIVVKINKEKSYLKLTWEGLQRELSSPPIHHQLPQTKGRCFSILLLQQEEGGCSHWATSYPMKDCYSSADKTPPHFQFSISYSGLCFQQPLRTSIFSIKELFLFFVFWTCT